MKAIRLFHRWIDSAWLDQGLLSSSPRNPPWRLEILPIGIVMSIIPLDWLPVGRDATMWPMIAAFLTAAFVQIYFGWRLQFIKSMTDISRKLARGEEPESEEVLKFTEAN